MKKSEKFILFIFLSVLIGLSFSKYVFNKEESKIDSSYKTIYLYQFGAYKDKNTMIDNCDKLENYFYYYKDGFYHVLLGISFFDNLNDKFKLSYDLENDLYIKKAKIKDHEFIENLKQYDNLIKNTDDKIVVVNAEKQILSKYESIIVKNE